MDPHTGGPSARFRTNRRADSGARLHPAPESGMTSERIKFCSRLSLTKAASFSSTSASSASREVELNGLRLSPACQSLGALARWSLLSSNGENYELLCVSRSAWGGSPPPSILRRFERWISDRNIRHVRGGNGVPCVERKN